MRCLLLSCALLLSGCATTPSASAQEAPTSPVQNCLTQAGIDHAARRACVGRYTGVCIELDDANSSTPGMVACAHSERMQWAERRSSYVAQLQARESETQRAMLDAMLAEHARWAPARCAYAASLYEGGTLARVVGAQCMRDAEAELALDLAVRFDEP